MRLYLRFLVLGSLSIITSFYFSCILPCINLVLSIIPFSFISQIFYYAYTKFWVWLWSNSNSYDFHIHFLRVSLSLHSFIFPALQCASLLRPLCFPLFYITTSSSSFLTCDRKINKTTVKNEIAWNKKDAVEQRKLQVNKETTLWLAISV